jgi:hypothetical protein
MVEFLEELGETCVQVYKEDIIVFSRGLWAHRENLRRVVMKLKQPQP